MNCRCPYCGKSRMDVDSHRHLTSKVYYCNECKNEFSWSRWFQIAATIVEDVCILVLAVFLSVLFRGLDWMHSIACAIAGLVLIFAFLRACDYFYKFITFRFNPLLRCSLLS